MPIADSLISLARGEPASAPTRIVAFDVDGTLIRGHSQALLARYLIERKYASYRLMIQIACWHTLYRLGVPLPVARIQRRMVRGFAGISIDHMHTMFDAFATEILLDRILPAAIEQIRAYRRDGGHVVLVSASLHPIIARLAVLVGADGVVATRLVPHPDGRFSGEIDGEIVYGEAKLDAVRRYADARFRDWILDAAYGDHETDRFLLTAARQAVAVNPDKRLATIARRRGWPIMHWDPA